jgi:hypothetical protein
LSGVSLPAMITAAPLTFSFSYSSEKSFMMVVKEVSRNIKDILHVSKEDEATP